MQSDKRGDSEAEAPGGRDDWAAMIALGLLYVVLSVVGDRLPMPRSSVSTIVSIVITLLVLVGAIYYLARIPVHPTRALVLGVGLLLVWGWLALVARAGATRPSIGAAVADVCLVAAAANLGKFAVRFVNARNILLPIAVATAIFDIVYVFGGPMETQRAIGGGALSVVTAAVPALGGNQIPGASKKGILGGIGFGDLAILGFFFTAALRFGMDAARSFWYILALTVVAFTIAVRYTDVPGWVPISLGFVLANYRFFRFTSEEKRAMLYAVPAVILLSGVFIGVSLLLKR
jgi:hypothetical protein